MKARLHAGVARWWAGDLGSPGAALTLLTAPLEWAVRAAVRRRNDAYDRRGGRRVEGLAVVSVGNLVVGGTGKTPLSAWAARRLAREGLRPAIVLRGYGGDETALHRRWLPDVPVEADPDRVRAALRARERGARVAVLDDGFQHRRLARDLDIVALAAEDAFPGRLLPRGPYREPPSSLRRAHAVVVTRRTASGDAAAELERRVRSMHPHLVVARLRLEAGAWTTLGGDAAEAPRGAAVVAAGVARPAAVARSVAHETGAAIELLPLRDHHRFTPRDVRRILRRAAGRPVVVTEKDAVKLAGLVEDGAPFLVLRQRLVWEGGEAAVTDALLAAARGGGGGGRAGGDDGGAPAAGRRP